MRKLVTFATVALCAITTAYAQPKLTVEGGDTHDWGKVKPAQSPLKTTLKITNSGTEQLTISDVKVGCGCTTTGIAKKELTPGETTTLDVSLNVGTNTGALTKTVSIMSNDPAAPTKTILLKADVVRAIQFVPTQYFSFNDLKLGTESTATVKVKNTTTEDIVLTDIEATNGLKTALKDKTTLKANSEMDIAVKLKPQAKGYFNGMLKMKTSNPDFPTLEVPAFGNVPDATSPVYMNEKK
jgi:LEA14-like dessication related protein